MDRSEHVSFRHCEPWNKGKLVGQKSPLRLKEIWAIRIRLQLAQRTRELALFNLAVDSKLRSCDLVRLRVRDITHGDQVATRAIVMQQKTQRPVQFEITEHTRESLADWVRCANRQPQDYLFPSRLHASPHLSTRQYARIVRGWVQQIGLNPARMEPPRCAAPRLRSSTAGQRISGPCSFCSGIQSSRVLCVTPAVPAAAWVLEQTYDSHAAICQCGTGLTQHRGFVIRLTKRTSCAFKSFSTSQPWSLANLKARTRALVSGSPGWKSSS